MRQRTKPDVKFCNSHSRLQHAKRWWLFTNWKAAALVAVVPLMLVLLTQAKMGLFSQVPQEKYDHLLGVAQAVGTERDYYQRQIQKFRKEMDTNKEARKTTQFFFPAYVPAPPSEANQ